MKRRKNVDRLSKISAFAVCIILVCLLIASDLLARDISFTTFAGENSYVFLYYNDKGSMHYLPIAADEKFSLLYNATDWWNLLGSFSQFNPANLTKKQKKRIQQGIGAQADGQWGKGSWTALANSIQNKNKQIFEINAGITPDLIIFKKQELPYGITLPAIPLQKKQMSSFWDSLRSLPEQYQEIKTNLSKLESQPLSIPKDKTAIPFSPELKALQDLGFKITPEDTEEIKIVNSYIAVQKSSKRNKEITSKISLKKGNFEKELNVNIQPIPHKSNYLQIIAFALAIILSMVAGFLLREILITRKLDLTKDNFYLYFDREIDKRWKSYDKSTKSFLERKFNEITSLVVRKDNAITELIALINDLSTKLSSLLASASIQFDTNTEESLSSPFDDKFKSVLMDKLKKIERYVEKNNQLNENMAHFLKSIVDILAIESYQEFKAQEMPKQVVDNQLLDELETKIRSNFKELNRKLLHLESKYRNFITDIGVVFRSISAFHPELNEFLDYDNFIKKYQSEEKRREKVNDIETFIGDLEMRIPLKFKAAEDQFSKIQKWVNAFLEPRKAAGDSVIKNEIDKLCELTRENILGRKNERSEWLTKFPFLIENAQDAYEQFWKSNDMTDTIEIALRALYKLDVAIANQNSDDSDYKSLYELRLGLKAVIYQLQSINLQFGRVYHEIVPNDFVNLDFMRTVGDLELLVSEDFREYAEKFGWQANRVKEVKYWGFSELELVESEDGEEQLAFQTEKEMKSVIVINREN